MPKLWKEIIAPGEFHTDNGLVLATPGRIKHWLTQFRKMRARGLPVPVPWEHQNNAKPRRLSEAEQKANEVRFNAGWCDDMLIDKGGSLWGLLDIPDEDDAEKIRKSVRFVSPEIDNHWVDGDGRPWDDIVTHIALTARPVFHRQKPFGANPQLSHPRRGCVWLSMDQRRGDQLMTDEPTDEDHIEACRRLLGAKLNVGLAPYTDESTFLRDLHTALHAHPGYADGAAEEAEPMATAFSGRRQLGHGRKGPAPVTAARGQQCAREQLLASGIHVQPSRLSAGTRQLSQPRARLAGRVPAPRRGREVLAEVLRNVGVIAK